MNKIGSRLSTNLNEQVKINTTQVAGSDVKEVKVPTEEKTKSKSSLIVKIDMSLYEKPKLERNQVSPNPPSNQTLIIKKSKDIAQKDKNLKIPFVNRRTSQVGGDVIKNSNENVNTGKKLSPSNVCTTPINKTSTKKTSTVAFNKLEKFVKFFSEKKAQTMQGARVENLFKKFNENIGSDSAKALKAYVQLSKADKEKFKLVDKSSIPVKFTELAKKDVNEYINLISKLIKSNPEHGHEILWQSKEGHKITQKGAENRHTYNTDKIAAGLTSRLEASELAGVVKYINKQQINEDSTKEGTKPLRGNNLQSKLVTAFAEKYVMPEFIKSFSNLMSTLPTTKATHEQIQNFAEKFNTQLETFQNGNTSKEFALFKEIQASAKLDIENAEVYKNDAETISKDLLVLRVSNPSLVDVGKIFGIKDNNQIASGKEVAKLLQRLNTGVMFVKNEDKSHNEWITKQLNKKLIKEQGDKWTAKDVFANKELFEAVNAHAEKSFQGETTHFLRDAFSAINNEASFKDFENKINEIKQKYVDSSSNEEININSEAREAFNNGLDNLKNISEESEKLTAGKKLLEKLANALCDNQNFWTDIVREFKTENK